MLDSTTRKRIDDCRDILVGKLPDPKSQIEQITIALIYKFMDDMDREAIELGGKAKFFSDGYAKYSWDSLFDAKVTASEMLKLYSESIESMEKNPNIPVLFRDIFKNAYLPYRDPETLKLFLKTIGEFEYTHSEKLGDAFEYLLSVMGSQGDAGQFRTPRHIIDFLVEAVDPSKTDAILDPACGTAGFLISAFKHIKEKNDDELTPEDRKKLIKNFIGYDISPDMVRLSLVNLYLHGFSEPHIFEYDTLTSEERWDDGFDVVLANPPFMSPKGGIRPHKRFTVSSNRSEVLFVDYIAEHLNPNGRAGIIVPEGIIFQSGKAYKELRKMLVDEYLYAVVSLPAGVFNPYSGVKTSILLIDKPIAKLSNKVLFVKIENDGYNLGAQRNEIKGGQLGEAIDVLADFKKSIENNSDFINTELAHAIDKIKLAENGEFNLSGDTYKIAEVLINTNYKMINLIDVCEIRTGKKDVNSGNAKGKYPFFTCAKEHTFSDHYSFDTEALLIAGNGDVGSVSYYNGKFEAYQRTYVLSTFKNITARFLYYLLKVRLKASVQGQKLGNTMPYIKLGMLKNFKIPIPPISEQEKIVIELESYQKVIAGAKIVVENYKPKIDICPEWNQEKLGEVSDFKNGLNFSKESSGESIKILGVSHFKNNLIAPISELDEIQVNEIVNDNYLLQKGDLVFVRSNGNKDLVGRSVVIPEIQDRISFSGFTIRCRLKDDINPLFIGYLFKSDLHKELMQNTGRGANIRNLSQGILNDIVIPIPPLSIQHEIVEKLEKEQELVNANKELISIFEQKIEDRITKVWGQ